MKANSVFRVFTTGVFLALLLPVLVQNGMFLDGVTYSSISRNLAEGFGSFWKPHYTKTLYPVFYEHPPLVFGIQSLFFRILGNSIATERIFTFLTAVITSSGIILCWKLFFKKSHLEKFSWLPVLLWISTPLVFWSYKNNLLENTMGIFTLFSVYFLTRAFSEKKIIWLFTGNILLVLAFLSKGFAGLFPLASIVIYWVTIKDNKPGIFIFYLIFTVFFPLCLFYLLAIISPGLKENINSYIHEQLIPSLENQREITTYNHFTILLKLLIELVLPVSLFILLIIRQKIKSVKIQFHYANAGIYFLMIAISASFPLIISLKQREFYLIPSIPFYIISLSIFISPYLDNILDSVSLKTLTWIKRLSFILIIFTITISIFNFGKYSRDEKKLKDIYLISQNIPSGTILQTTKKLWFDWSFQAYMCRIGYLSLDYGHGHEYFISGSDDAITPEVNENFSKLDLDLQEYIVFKKKNSPNTRVNEIR